MANAPRILRTLIVMMAAVLVWHPTLSNAQTDAILNLCPLDPIARRGTEYPVGGIILTTFDRANLWVYNVGSNVRYPLPETFPCAGNCRLSPDGRWLLYLNDLTNAFNRMRVDGTQRELVSEYASAIEWWSLDTFLIWTPGQQVYIQRIGSTDREYLDARGVTSVQPNGRWGLLIEQDGDVFRRSLIDLTSRASGSPIGIVLGEDRSLFNAAAWSPDGAQLAYVAPVGESSEVFLVDTVNLAPTQLTQLTPRYGNIRINGIAAGDLSWSPDGTRIAFWVTPNPPASLTTPDPSATPAPLPEASLHIVDVVTNGQITSYCQYTTTNTLPNPPRLVWSPDGTHIAFGGNVIDPINGYPLIALDTSTGIFTILSSGLYPALGNPDVTAWGVVP
jgi:Tol biopolymer transport system component